MATPATTIRMDSKLKDGASQILGSLGLSLSAAVNVFLNAVVREGGIPFSVTLDGHSPKTASGGDEVFERYIAPIISGRTERSTAQLKADGYRKRLMKMRDLIYQSERVM